MNGKGILRDKARELIQAGRVPRRLPDRIWGGSAFGGQCCLLCGIPVAPNEIALEVEFSSDANTRTVHTHFHSPCFLALELEILGLKADGGGVAHGDPLQPAAMINRIDATGALDASQP